MKVFVVTGIDNDDLYALLDKTIVALNPTNQIVVIGADIGVEFDCFDTSTNTHIRGAQALSELIIERKKAFDLLQK